MNVQPEELIYMIGELYIEATKSKQVNLRLAKQVDELKKEGDKDAGSGTNEL